MADNHIKFPTPTGDAPEKIAPEVNPPRPEDVFPDLGNEELIKAMEELNKHEDQTTQTKMLEKAIGAKFFAPVEIIDKDGNVLKGSGKVAIPKDAKFNFKLIQNARGEQFFTVFTDVKEYLKWRQSPKVNVIVVVFPQIAQLAQEKADTIKGFVINPMSQNIIFTQDVITNILTTMKTLAEKEMEKRQAAEQQPEPIKLMFGKAQNIPEAVYGAFRKKLMKIPQVKEAYFCMLRQENHDYYLFTLDIDADNETCRDIGNSICDAAKLFLTKYPVMAAPVNSPFGEGAKKVGEPFYTKSE